MGRLILATLFLLNSAVRPAAADPATPSLQDEDTLVVTCPVAGVLSDDPSTDAEAGLIRGGGLLSAGMGGFATSMVVFVTPQELASLRRNQASLAVMKQYLEAYQRRLTKTLEYRAVKNEIREFYRRHDLTGKVKELIAQGKTPSAELLFEGRDIPNSERTRIGALGARRAVLMHELHVSKEAMRRAFIGVAHVVPMSAVRHNARYRSIQGKAETFQRRVEYFQQKVNERSVGRARMAGAGVIAVVGGLFLYAASDAVAGYFSEAGESPEKLSEAEMKAMEAIIPCLANELEKREAGVSADTEVLMRLNDAVVPVNPTVPGAEGR